MRRYDNLFIQKRQELKRPRQVARPKNGFSVDHGGDETRGVRLEHVGRGRQVVLGLEVRRVLGESEVRPENEIGFDFFDLEAKVGRYGPAAVRVKRAVAVQAGSIARREVSVDFEEGGEVAEGQAVPEGQDKSVVSAVEPAANRAELRRCPEPVGNRELRSGVGEEELHIGLHDLEVVDRTAHGHPVGQCGFAADSALDLDAGPVHFFGLGRRGEEEQAADGEQASEGSRHGGSPLVIFLRFEEGGTVSRLEQNVNICYYIP